jgi:hypothetical protein
VTIVFPGIMRLMSETSETPTVRSATATAPPPAVTDVVHRPPRVFQVAAWVAIVAGIVFIVAVIFFSGYALGKHSGHAGYGHHKHHAMMHHPHRMMGPGGGPAATPQGGNPSATPTPAGPGQLPSSVTPTPPR